MNSEMYKNSFFYNAWKDIVGWYLNFEHQIELISEQSTTNKISNKIINTLKTAFNHSYIVGVTDIIQKKSIEFPENSVVIRTVIGIGVRALNKTNVYVEQAWCSNLVNNMSRYFMISPKKTGLILSILITANCTILLFFNYDVSLLEWIIRGILLFSGVALLFSNLEWNELTDGSRILKNISS